MKTILKNIITIILISIFVLSTNISFAVTKSEIDSQKNEKEQIENKLKNKEERQKELENKKSETMKEVESISSEIDKYESQIDNLDAQIDEANRKIKEAEENLTKNEKEHKEKEKMMKQRLVAIYEAGETSFLDFILTSQNLTDFISSYYLVSEVAEMDTELLKQLEEQKKEIEDSKKKIEEGKQELSTAKASKESVSNELKNKKSEKDKSVAKLSEEEKEIEKEIEELRQDNIRMASQIKEAERKYKEQLNALQGNSSGSSGTSGGSSVPATGSGYLMRPVSGGSISCFGYYSSGRFHGAIDYAVPSGTPVYAAADGVVMVTANLTSSYGTHVIIRHANGMQTYYAHGTYGSICVSPGEIVRKGQKIMSSGNTGNSQGPHLHFEVRVSPYSYNGYATGYGQDSRVNPAAYM